MGSAIGKSIKEFRKGMNELTAPKDDDLSSSFSSTRLEEIEREIASKRAAAAEAERARATGTTTGEAAAENKSTEQPVE
jgi:Sec-independent protein translocase protein TatA